MASKSLARAEQTLARAQTAVTRARVRNKETTHAMVQRAGLVVSAAGLAEVEQHVPSVFLRIPTKIWFAGAAYLLAAMTKGNLSKVALGIGDGVAGVYCYKAAFQVKTQQAGSKSPSFVPVGYVEEV